MEKGVHMQPAQQACILNAFLFINVASREIHVLIVFTSGERRAADKTGRGCVIPRIGKLHYFRLHLTFYLIHLPATDTHWLSYFFQMKKIT